MAARPPTAMLRLVPLLLVVLVLVPISVRCGSMNDCHGVRYAYRDRGIDIKDVPRQPTQGTQLQICPRGLTCCTESMEQKLRVASKDHYKKAMKTSANDIQRLFNSKANKFDEFFTDLLATSKLKFHKLFQKTYGIIYERNSDVFIDFFKDLEAYYDQGQVDLNQALDKFFEALYQRMFTVLNTGREFDYMYLNCVSKTMKTLLPFGDVPEKLTDQLRRSFVATRTFAQALLQGKKVVNRILDISPKDECVVALTKMSSCPACVGISEIKPCSNYCMNVMKGCLAYHAELEDSWDKFIDNLQLLGDRLIGPFDIEAVVDPIGVKISEAIMNFQSSGVSLTEKVFQECDPDRRRHKRQTPYGHAYDSHRSNPMMSGSVYNEDTKLKLLIKEILEAVGEAKGFWTRLPHRMCQQTSIETSPRQRTSENGACWNGHETGDYRNSVVNDGFLSQSRNPEVRVDVSKPDNDINEQIYKLKQITQKVDFAAKGQDVEWPSAYNTNSYDSVPAEGSGGVGCDYPNSDDEDCGYDYDDYYGSGSGDYEDSGDAYPTHNEMSHHEREEDEHTDDSSSGIIWPPPWVDKGKDEIRIEDNSNHVGHGSANRPTLTTSSTTSTTAAAAHVVVSHGLVAVTMMMQVLLVLAL